MTFDAEISNAETAVDGMSPSERDGDNDPGLFANKSAGL